MAIHIPQRRITRNVWVLMHPLMGIAAWMVGTWSTGPHLVHAQRAGERARQVDNREGVKTVSSSATGRAAGVMAETGRAGGGAQADFDSLIDLIVSTIAPDTWEDVGGPGTIEGFAGGVYVDPRGILRQLDSSTHERLAPRWKQWNVQRQQVFEGQDVARRSPLRKVSIPRLFAAYRESQTRNQPPDEAMRYLAGLERIDYLIIDPAENDYILAGPADIWRADGQGRKVAAHSGRPVLWFEDLVVLLNNAFHGPGHFACSITPTQAGLVQAQRYIAESAATPVAPGRRDAWLEGFRSALGLQRIEVGGIDANTRVARVIVEADHHMKQIGIGLAHGTDQVDSYLDLLVSSGQIPPRMDVLRWWFTLNEQAVRADRAGELYAFGAQAVQVLSENEFLTRKGERIHTGRSHPLNERFAEDFTADFVEIARRYPVYADLDNLFRLALVSAILREEGREREAPLAITAWLPSSEDAVTTARAPEWVESIVNHRRVDRGRFVAAVSGGVRFTPPAITSLAKGGSGEDLQWRSTRPVAHWWWV